MRSFERGKKYDLAHPPNARFIGVKCRQCGQKYKMDTGGKDRHEYVTIVNHVMTTCPLCGYEMNFPDKFMYYGVVSN